jgi:hypothetical protein
MLTYIVAHIGNDNENSSSFTTRTSVMNNVCSTFPSRIEVQALVWVSAEQTLLTLLYTSIYRPSAK